MSEGTYGPSWADVAAAVEDVQARRGFRPLFTMAVPHRNPRTQEWVSWGVCAARPPLPGRPTSGKAAWAYWGRGGAHKSASAAAYRALLDLDAALDAEEAGARQLAMF